MQLVKELKNGLGSFKIELVKFNEEKLVLKHFKTLNKLKAEIMLYELFQEELFVPKIKYVDYNNKILGLTYCGSSLNMIPPKDRHIYKDKIRTLAKFIESKYGIYHNDIRWKNICFDDNNNIYFIDWERWSYDNKERDPEYILNDRKKTISPDLFNQL